MGRSTAKSNWLSRIPLIAFFVYVLYLCILYHSRTLEMPDFGRTFDSWWYFIERVRQGEFPLWNPYALFGHINTQWNFISVAAFTPFVLFAPFTLGTYKVLSVLSTFGMIWALYFSARKMGYDRYLCLVPLLIFVGAPYLNQALSFLPYFDAAFFYPLAVGMILGRLLKGQFPPIKMWLVFVGMMALALVGTRMDTLAYAIGFLVHLFLILALNAPGFGLRKLPTFALLMGLVTAILLCSLWQFPFIMQAAFDNPRLSLGGPLNALQDSLFWSGVGLTLCHQAPLWVACLCALFARRFRREAPQLVCGHIRVATLFYPISLSAMVAAMLMSCEPYGQLFESPFGFELMVFACALMVALVAGHIAFHPSVQRGALLRWLVGAFLGLHAAHQIYYMGLNPAGSILGSAVFLTLYLCGTVRLYAHPKRRWIVYLMCSWLFIGQTGVFFLNELAGIPWLPLRSYHFALPFIFLILMEGLALIVRGGALLCKTWFPRGSLASFRDAIGLGFKATAFLVVLALFKFQLIPGNDEVFYAADAFTTTTVQDVYQNAFKRRPYYGTYLDTSLTYSLKIRNTNNPGGPFKRVSVADHVHFRTYPGEIFQAFTQKLNDAPLYSSDIPSLTAKAFYEIYNNKLPLHPEYGLINRFYRDYKNEQIARDHVRVNTDFGSSVVINPIRLTSPIAKEMLAVEGSHTPRAQVSDRIYSHINAEAEYESMKKMAEKGQSLFTRGLVTSDSRLMTQLFKTSKTPLRKTITFLQDDAESVRIKVNTNKDSFLSLLDAYAPGWEATIDGQETPLYRAFVASRVVAVPRGEHEVQFSYHVIGFRAACWVSLLSVFGLLFLYLSPKLAQLGFRRIGALTYEPSA